MALPRKRTCGAAGTRKESPGIQRETSAELQRRESAA